MADGVVIKEVESKVKQRVSILGMLETIGVNGSGHGLFDQQSCPLESALDNTRLRRLSQNIYHHTNRKAWNELLQSSIAPLVSLKHFFSKHLEHFSRKLL